jgi:hypothetical protein
VRHGTTTLFAALEVATGRITADACYPRHRNGEFLAFLNKVAKAHPRVPLHVVCDNYGTHSHPKVKAWLARNPRITLHFTPTSASWMNMVEILWDHHPSGHPTRHLHQRLQRTLRTFRLDQDSRPDPHQNQPSKDLRHGTLDPLHPAGSPSSCTAHCQPRCLFYGALCDQPVRRVGRGDLAGGDPHARSGRTRNGNALRRVRDR